jgi:hypothetical protein
LKAAAASKLAVSGFRRATGLRDHHHQGAGKVPRQPCEHIVHAIGIGVIEKRDGEFVGFRLPQSMLDELRPQRRAADPDDQKMGERALRPDDFTPVHASGKRLDRGEGRTDLPAQFRSRGEVGGA